MAKINIELGDMVEDSVTGFKGVAIGVTRWLHGCNRIIVQPTGITKDGKIFENQSFDEPQLKVTKRAKVKAGDGETGGERFTPGMKQHVTRD